MTLSHSFGIQTLCWMVAIEENEGEKGRNFWSLWLVSSMVERCMVKRKRMASGRDGGGGKGKG